MNSRSIPATTLGAFYIVLGSVLLVGTSGVIELQWAVMGPLLVMAAGALVLLAGAARLHNRNSSR